jgi:hypothetical protein
VQRLDLAAHHLGPVLQPPARAAEGVGDGELRIGEAFVETWRAINIDRRAAGHLDVDGNLVETAAAMIAVGYLEDDVAGGQPTEKLLEVLDLLLDQLPDGATGAMAQEPGRVYRLGGVSSSPTNAPQFAAMFDALRRLGFIMGSTGSREFVALQDAARARGVELLIHQIVRAEEITPAIDAAKASGAAALNVLSSPFLYGNRQIVMQRADMEPRIRQSTASGRGRGGAGPSSGADPPSCSRATRRGASAQGPVRLQLTVRRGGSLRLPRRSKDTGAA